MEYKILRDTIDMAKEPMVSRDVMRAGVENLIGAGRIRRNGASVNARLSAPVPAAWVITASSMSPIGGDLRFVVLSYLASVTRSRAALSGERRRARRHLAAGLRLPHRPILTLPLPQPPRDPQRPR